MFFNLIETQKRCFVPFFVKIVDTKLRKKKYCPLLLSLDRRFSTLRDLHVILINQSQKGGDGLHATALELWHRAKKVGEMGDLLWN